MPITHTPVSGFTAHLFELTAAVDKVQPLADYRGNVDALHALVVLKDAMKQVARDIAPFVGDLAMTQPSSIATDRISPHFRHHVLDLDEGRWWCVTCYGERYDFDADEREGREVEA